MNEIEWNACIRCNENEVGGSFSVLIFIGAVPDDPMQWMKSTSCVGVHDVFAGYGESRDEAEVEGFVDLKEGLKKARIGSLTPDVVVPFLKDELHWRVQNIKGDAVQMKSLKVEVMSTPLLQVPNKAPTMGKSHFYPEITRGRSG